MRTGFLISAAVGALLISPVSAQTNSASGAGAMTQEDMEKLSNAFEEAGLTGFRPVTGGDVFRGMSADGDAAVIAVAPEAGNTAADGGDTGNSAGTGMAGAEMFQATTAEGHTLYIVVRPEMTENTTGTGTTGDASDTGTEANNTETADASTDEDENEDNAGDAGATTTAADNDDAATANNNAGDATGGEMTMNVELSGEQQVPPVETSGTGQVQVTFNNESRELSWKLDYSDLSSDATAAHFHGPADPGETADPVVPLEDFSDGAEGSATLTEGQAEQLMAGKWYFNLHTENNPNGEIRGQVTTVQ